MARRKNRAEILADIEDLKRQLAESEEREERRIGKLANKAGLLDLDISDEELAPSTRKPTGLLRFGTPHGLAARDILHALRAAGCGIGRASSRETSGRVA